jgi:hypothetical protein
MEKKVEYFPVHILFEDGFICIFIILALILPGFGIVYLSNKELFQVLPTTNFIFVIFFAFVSHVLFALFVPK